MAPQPIKIDQISEGTIAGPDNRPQSVVVVTFHAGNFGPFSQSFPRAPFDPAQANTELQAFSDKLALLKSV